MIAHQESSATAVFAADLVERFGGQLFGQARFPVVRFKSLAVAGPTDAAFVAHAGHLSQASQSSAGLMVLPPEGVHLAERFSSAIVVEDAYLFFARAAGLLLAVQREVSVARTLIHPTAVVAASAKIGERVRIGPAVIIGERVEVGDGTDIEAGAVIGHGVRLGVHCLIHARVSIGQEVCLGDRVVVQSGAVIGSDGFGFARSETHQWVKIPQVGSVIICNDVEIGANTTIDRGTLEDTMIGEGVKLDNLIQVAHNVQIGEHTAIAGCVGIAGSAKIGRYCQIGGAAGILGHLTIADHVVIGPKSLVMSSIDQPGKYVGVFPLQLESDWEKSAVLVKRLPAWRRQLQQISRALARFKITTRST